MSSWDDLRVVLRELEAAEPRPLWMLPSPGSEKMTPPHRIMLRAWAADVAEQLDARFGNDVLLTVGFLPYPAERPLDPMGVDRSPPSASQDPLLEESVDVSGTKPIVVRSGHDLECELLVTNRSTAPLVIEHPGALLGRDLAPATGEVVGDSDRAHAWIGIAPWVRAAPADKRPPPVRFTVLQGEAVTVRLLVGTASYRRSLGYAVPPGEWAVEVVLDLGTGRRRRAPPLSLHVTS